MASFAKTEITFVQVEAPTWWHWWHQILQWLNCWSPRTHPGTFPRFLSIHSLGQCVIMVGLVGLRFSTTFHVQIAGTAHPQTTWINHVLRPFSDVLAIWHFLYVVVGLKKSKPPYVCWNHRGLQVCNHCKLWFFEPSLFIVCYKLRYLTFPFSRLVSSSINL